MQQQPRRKPAPRKQTLNHMIVDEAAVVRTQRADFSDLAGRWIPDPAFDEIIAAQRLIDWDRWK